MIDSSEDLVEKNKKQSDQLGYSLYDDDLLSRLKQRFTYILFFWFI